MGLYPENHCTFSQLISVPALIVGSLILLEFIPLLSDRHEIKFQSSVWRYEVFLVPFIKEAVPSETYVLDAFVQNQLSVEV